MRKDLAIVRGGGDLATGTILKLYSCGFKVLVLETYMPASIRRNVSFSEAVYDGKTSVEGVEIKLAKTVEDAEKLLDENRIAIMTDPEGDSIRKLEPLAVVDAIMAKKNLGTTIDMAPVTVALGPGFTAGKDVDAVIETMRGHSLGRVIYDGQAIRNTGIPGNIGGYTSQRVIHAPAAGILKNICFITDEVTEGQIIAEIRNGEETVPVYATITGILRGLIRDGYEVKEGFKIADIDPRKGETENCFTVSDKARCIAGGVLEAILHLGRNL